MSQTKVKKILVIFLAKNFILMTTFFMVPKINGLLTSI